MTRRGIASLPVTLVTVVLAACAGHGTETQTPVNTPAPTLTTMPQVSPTPFTIGPAGRERPATPDIAELVIADLDGQNQHVLLQLAEHISNLGWSPDGRYLAYLESYQWLETFDLEAKTRARIAFPSGDGRCDDFDWSLDGAMIACVSGLDVFVGRPDGSEAWQITTDAGQSDYDQSDYEWRRHLDFWGWSPVDPTFVYSISSYNESKPGELYLAGPSREPEMVFQSPNSIDAAAWSPDGQQLLVVAVSHNVTPTEQPRPQAHILLLAAADGMVRELTQLEAFVSSASWSHDGRSLALIASGTGESPGNGTYVVDVTTGLTRHLTPQDPGLGDFQCCPAWSGDDDVLLVRNPPWESVYEGAFLIPVQGGDRIPLPRHYYRGPPAWSPDGDEVLLGGSTLLVAGKDGETSTLLAEAEKTYFAAAWSPKGDKIAFVRAPTANYVYSVRPDGSDLRRETPFDLESLADREPVMQADSPDGRVRAEMRGDGLHLVDRSSGGDVSLAASFETRVHFDSTVVWSPNGSRIAFSITQQQPYRGPAIFVASPDGTNITQVTQSGLYGHLLLEWSSDGERILFAVTWPLGP